MAICLILCVRKFGPDSNSLFMVQQHFKSVVLSWRLYVTSTYLDFLITHLTGMYCLSARNIFPLCVYSFQINVCQ